MNHLEIDTIQENEGNQVQQVLEEQLRVANHRLSNLEKAHTPAGQAIS